MESNEPDYSGWAGFVERKNVGPCHVPPKGPPVKLSPGYKPFILVTLGLTIPYVLILKYNLIPWLSAPYPTYWQYGVYLNM